MGDEARMGRDGTNTCFGEARSKITVRVGDVSCKCQMFVSAIDGSLYGGLCNKSWVLLVATGSLVIRCMGYCPIKALALEQD